MNESRVRILAESVFSVEALKYIEREFLMFFRCLVFKVMTMYNRMLQI